MKKIIFRLYRSIYLFFLRKIGSDKFTSKAAALSWTSFGVSVIIVVFVNILLYLLFNKNYFLTLNRFVVFCFFFTIFLLAEYQIKKLVEKY